MIIDKKIEKAFEKKNCINTKYEIIFCVLYMFVNKKP